jgi:hypothetical protein
MFANPYFITGAAAAHLADLRRTAHLANLKHIRS